MRKVYTHFPAKLVDEPLVGGRQLEFPDEAVGNREILQIAMQQLSVKLVKFLTTVDVYDGGNGPRNCEDDDRLHTQHTRYAVHVTSTITFK